VPVVVIPSWDDRGGFNDHIPAYEGGWPNCLPFLVVSAWTSEYVSGKAVGGLLMRELYGVTFLDHDFVTRHSKQQAIHFDRILTIGLEDFLNDQQGPVSDDAKS
jgi:hypothetical protein